MIFTKNISVCLLALCPFFLALSEKPAALPPHNPNDWPQYGGHPGSTRYSALDQINTTNVAKLKQAWVFQTGDPGQMQCQPIVVGGIAYLTSANIHVFALDGATGRKIWEFDPFVEWGGQNSWAGTNRGVTFWQSEDGSEQRILFCAGHFLISLDARTGKPDPRFGNGGKIDLQKNLDTGDREFLLVSNTPGTIYKDLIIMGMRLAEDLSAAPGHVRAFDVRTGERRWIFHTIPQPGEKGRKTWKNPAGPILSGGANCWAGMTLDEQTGTVFVPTGSATYDFWGGNRLGDNLYANCLLALDAATGKLRWHYQFVHHDVWDRDLPANPNLVTLKKGKKNIEAVAQITKQGYVFLFDRRTGKPIFPIKEQPVPPSSLAGEKLSRTQPVPVLPEPYMRTTFTEADVNDVTPEYRAEILPRFQALQSGNMWLPPSEQGLALFPGFDGGGEWGGAGFDPQTGWLYVNANEMPWVVRMVENKPVAERGQAIFRSKCANCHGLEGKGNLPAFPPVLGMEKKYTSATMQTLLKNGKGAMPPFAHLPAAELEAVTDFLLKTAEAAPKEAAGTAETPQTPYLMTGYERFTTQDGLPAIRPPWGTLNAIDLNTGKIVWKTPLGELETLKKQGIAPTGTENYGGPAVTAGGLVFIGASKDEMFRAFDKQTGRILWETKLPAGAYATPAVYAVGGRQFVLVTCGGGKMGTKKGDFYVAFSL